MTMTPQPPSPPPVRPRRLVAVAAAAAVVIVVGLIAWSARRSALAHEDGHHGTRAGAGAGDLDQPRELSAVSRSALGIRTAPVGVRSLEEVMPLTGAVRVRPDRMLRVASPVAGIVRRLDGVPGRSIGGPDAGAGGSGPVVAVIESVEAGRLQGMLLRQAELLRESRRHLAESAEAARRIAVSELAGLVSQLPVVDDGLASAQRQLELIRRGGDSVPQRDRLAAELDVTRATASVRALETRLAAVGVGAAALGKLRSGPGRADVAALLADGTLKWDDVLVLGRPLDLLEREHELQELIGDVARLSREVGLLGFPADHVAALVDGKAGPRPVEVRLPAGGVGTVLARHASVGQGVTEGQTLLELADLAAVHVEVDIPEGLWSRADVRIGQTARLRCGPAGADVITGTVAGLVPSVDVTSRTLHVLVDPDPAVASRLPVNAAVDVTLVIRTARDTPAVPRDALVRMGPVAFVWVERRHGDHFEYVRRDVVPGIADDRWVEVGGGTLKPGTDAVVTRGAFQLTLVPAAGPDHDGDHGHEH